MQIEKRIWPWGCIKEVMRTVGTGLLLAQNMKTAVPYNSVLLLTKNEGPSILGCRPVCVAASFEYHAVDITASVETIEYMIKVSFNSQKQTIMIAFVQGIYSKFPMATPVRLRADLPKGSGWYSERRWNLRPVAAHVSPGYRAFSCARYRGQKDRFANAQAAAPYLHCDHDVQWTKHDQIRQLMVLERDVEYSTVGVTGLQQMSVLETKLRGVLRCRRTSLVRM